MATLYSPAAQAYALRGMCSQKPEISGTLLAGTDESYFHGDESKEAYEAIIKYIGKKGHPPSFKLLIEDLRLSGETREFLSEAEGSPKSFEQAQEVVEKLGAYRHARLFYVHCKKGLELLQANKLDMDAIVAQTQETLTSLQIDKDVANQLFHVGKDGNMDALMEEVIYGEDNDQWIPTGWKTFDRTNLGMPRGGLVLIGGASGSGKSHVCLQLAKNQALLGYKVVVVPLEMTEQEEAIRLLANLGQLDSLKISGKKLEDEEKDWLWRRYRKFQRAVEAQGGRLTVFRPKSDVSIEETMAAVHSYGPDLIYIDYLGLLKGADGEDQWRQMGRIARYGKVYAGNHKKIVCMAVQLSEEGRIRYSQMVKEHASLAFAFVATQESRSGEYLIMDMLKGRNQRQQQFTLKVNYATSTVKDLDPKEQEALEGGPAPVKGDTKGGPAKKGERPAPKATSKTNNESFMPDLD